MQAADLSTVLRKAAQLPSLAGIHISSVWVSTVHDWTHDALLRIVWSMPDVSAAIDLPGASLPGLMASAISRPSDTCITLRRELMSLVELETAVLQAAWSLGASELRRLERSPLPTGADQSRYGLSSDFGSDNCVIAGHPVSTGDRASPDTLSAAAQNGWITWQFCPAVLAEPIRRARAIDADSGLQPNGSRAGSVGNARARWYNPDELGTGHEHVYEMAASGPSGHARPVGKARGGKLSAVRRLARRALARASRNQGS